MAEDTTATAEQPQKAAEGEQEAAREETVPYERFAQVNRKAKEAGEAQKAAEKQLADLRAQLEERETAGLPELDQMRKRLEAAERRAEESERKATEAEAHVARSRKERWITAAAAAQNFADPSDAAAFLSLDDIDDEKDAERAVKRLAAAKKHLIKPEERKLPGRVLEGGQPVPLGTDGRPDPAAQQRQEEASMLLDGLRGTQTFQRIAGGR